jgi:UDP-glucose 4-epimerase
MEVVIIRPPLVYGAGAKANFAALLKLVKKGLPLPFGLVKFNRRSMVSVYNLVDLIIACISNPKAANQVFLVSDDDDLSTAELIKHMAIAVGRAPRLLPLPVWCFKLVGRLIGKAPMVDRLVGSLQVNISHTKDTLGWKPPYTVSESMKLTVQSDRSSS